MEMEYNPKDFESKWQQRWFEDLFYEAKDFAKGKEKYYLLAEFPYPSGDSMHMGHTRNYCMMDTVARLRRMLGQNVLFPMGWDAFGLPTENYAIKVKRPPQEITKENIDNFRKQLKSLGLSFDWSREVNTTDPEYYKWTQWIFLKLYEKGLAYKAEMPINWCPKCKVGCANEEVIDGKHERCGTEVGKKNMNQWFLRITEYADRLDTDLDMTDYWESVKVRQRNWIGKKTWYDIEYEIEGTEERIKVSTTRPDTQFGSTFVVIAPEHEVVERLKKYMKKEILEEVGKYQEESRERTELERMNEKREKTGVKTELFCINSITKKRMPIYLADFVLTTVGTGCVVSVPAHDKRDFEFAKKFKIPVIRVIEGPGGDRAEVRTVSDVYEGDGVLFNSGFLDNLTSEKAKEKIGEYIRAEGIGDVVVRYHLRDWNFSRQHYWGEPIPIVYCKKCGEVPVPENQLPVELPKVKSYEPTETGESPLANITQWVNTRCPKCGGEAKRETDTMPNWAGSSWYYLRYVDPRNSDKLAGLEKIKYWLPVDYYEGGPEHVTLHLLYSRFWHKFLYDIGAVTTLEPYQKRTIHGNVLGEDGLKMSKSRGNVINPDDLVEKYGADVTRAYMMFMGPYEGDVSWSTEAINGMKRFVSKYYRFLLSSFVAEDVESSEEVSKAIGKLIKKLERNILGIKFNTCISSLIEFLNEFHQEKISQKDLEKLLICSAPIFPHLTEEIWEKTGHEFSVHMQSWPKVDESAIKDDVIEIPVQINGKIRGKIILQTGATQKEAEEKVLLGGDFSSYLENKKIKKIVYVQDRIVSIVV